MIKEVTKDMLIGQILQEDATIAQYCCYFDESWYALYRLSGISRGEPGGSCYGTWY